MSQCWERCWSFKFTQFTNYQFVRSIVSFSKQNLYHNGNIEHSHTRIYIVFNFAFPHFLWPFPGRNIHNQWKKEKKLRKEHSVIFFSKITENTTYVALIFLFQSTLSWTVLSTNIRKLNFSCISLTFRFLDRMDVAGTLTIQLFPYLQRKKNIQKNISSFPYITESGI